MCRCMWQEWGYVPFGFGTVFWPVKHDDSNLHKHSLSMPTGVETVGLRHSIAGFGFRMLFVDFGRTCVSQAHKAP